MEDSGYIFNPYQWKKNNAVNLTEEQITSLDDRYINVGEDLSNQTVDNMQLTNLNITTTGKIYFAGTNTEQTTAYDPNLIIEEINNFLSANNLFTGDNTFVKLLIKDPTSTQTSQITESGINLNIQNNNNSGSIMLKLKDGSGTVKNLIIDQFANMNGINEMSCSRVNCGRDIRINSTASKISIDGGNNLLITNNIGDAGIKLITSTSSSTSEFLFDSTGTLYVPSVIWTTLLKASTIKFNDNQQMYSLLNNLIIDNNALASSFKLNNYDISGIRKTLTIDSSINISGVNILNCNSINLSNLTHSITTEGEYTINNYVRGGSINFKNSDDTGIQRKITIDKIMNVSGINDLYAQKIYLNNTLLDLTEYDEMLTNTQAIKSTATYNTSIEYDTGRLLFLPAIETNHISRNGIIKSGDNVLLGYNLASFGANVLTLCPWTTSSNPVGIRATNINTELYKPKVMDNLKFPDNTTQTTAMTDAYLESKILNMIERLNLTTQVPTGTILPYGGRASNPPTGFLGCLGQYVLIATYQNLFDVIGHNFQRGHTTSLPSGYFWLPDLQGAFLKGIGASEIWGTLPTLGNSYVGQDPISFVGEFQKYNVGKHRHQYTDRGTDNKTVGSGSTTQAVKGSNGTYYTGELTFDANNNQLNEENRPNCIGVCYIIKY